MSLGAISPNYQRPLRDRFVLAETQLLEIGTDQEKNETLHNPYAFHKLLVPARIQEFLSGGCRPDGKKTAWTTFFFSPQRILQFTEGIQWFNNRENYTFPGSRGVPAYFPGRGDQLFSRGGGVPNANIYRNPYNL